MTTLTIVETAAKMAMLDVIENGMPINKLTEYAKSKAFEAATIRYMELIKKTF